MIRETLKFIKISCYDNAGKVSSGRVSSYFLLASILFSNICFALIDVANVVHTLAVEGKTYEIPGMHFAIYGATLAHHLALLGIRMNSKAEPTLTESKSINQDTH